MAKEFPEERKPNIIEAKDPIYLFKNQAGCLKGIAIKEANQKRVGACRFANQQEVNDGEKDNLAISPLTLKKSTEFEIITSDAKLQMNRRYIIKNSSAKYLQLSFDETKKIQVGDWIEIKNMGKFYQLNSSDKINILINGSSTRSKNGYIRSLKMGDFIKLECLEDSPNILLAEMCTIGNFIKA